MDAVTVTCYTDGVRRSYQTIARAMHAGITAHGDVSSIVPRFAFREARVGVMYGWKFHRILQRHSRFLYADRAYWRRDVFWRFAANDWSPTKGMLRGMPADRLRALDVQVLPEHGGDYVLVLGASAKAMREHGFAHLAWERNACRELKRLGAKVLFRPKPSKFPQRDSLGAEFAPSQLLERLFAGASMVVAHHSNGCVEAIAAGCAVHCVKGVAVERSVPLEAWRDPPRLPGREQFLADVAYTQWTVEEMRSGEAWRHMREGVLQ